MQKAYIWRIATLLFHCTFIEQHDFQIIASHYTIESSRMLLSSELFANFPFQRFFFRKKGVTMHFAPLLNKNDMTFIHYLMQITSFVYMHTKTKNYVNCTPPIECSKVVWLLVSQLFAHRFMFVWYAHDIDGVCFWKKKASKIGRYMERKKREEERNNGPRAPL